MARPVARGHALLGLLKRQQSAGPIVDQKDTAAPKVLPKLGVVLVVLGPLIGLETQAFLWKPRPRQVALVAAEAARPGRLIHLGRLRYTVHLRLGKVPTRVRKVWVRVRKVGRLALVANMLRPTKLQSDEYAAAVSAVEDIGPSRQVILQGQKVVQLAVAVRRRLTVVGTVPSPTPSRRQKCVLQFLPRHRPIRLLAALVERLRNKIADQGATVNSLALRRLVEMLRLVGQIKGVVAETMRYGRRLAGLLPYMGEPLGAPRLLKDGLTE